MCEFPERRFVKYSSPQVYSGVFKFPYFAVIDLRLIRLAGDRGLEPRLTDPESVVLPLDESPSQAKF